MALIDLSKFVVPPGFRGRSAAFVQLWWLVEAVLFRPSPQFAYAYRSWLLRLFGAKVGVGSVIRPSVRITYPWKVALGDYVWIGDDVVLYSLGNITVGSNSVISQGSYICAGDHDYRQVSFPIRARDVTVGNEVWLAARVFVGPGVSVADGCVVGASSVVMRNLEKAGVWCGNPCRYVRSRLP